MRTFEVESCHNLDPPRGRWQHAEFDGGSFWVLAGGVRIVDPTYADDFWSLPGYAGDGSDLVRWWCPDQVRGHRHRRRRQPGDGGVTLSGVPTGDLTGADLVVLSGAAAGETIPFVTVNGMEVGLGGGSATGAIAPGDRVRIRANTLLGRSEGCLSVPKSA